MHYRLIRKLPDPVIQTYVKRSPKLYSQNNKNDKSKQCELNFINCQQKQISHFDVNEIKIEEKQKEDHDVANEILA